MMHTQPQAISPAELGPVQGTVATPFPLQVVVLTQFYIELQWKANYWPAQYEWLVERKAALQAEVAALHAISRDLAQRLYGAKSENLRALDELERPSRLVSASGDNSLTALDTYQHLPRLVVIPAADRRPHSIPQ